MKIIKCDQGSNEWFEQRLGRATASEFKRILTPKKCEFAAAAKEYAYELIAESLAPGICRWASKEYESIAMRRGTLSEAEARRWFSLETGRDADEVGFVIADCDWMGASPDALIGDDDGLELKCPLPRTHIKYLCEGGLPDEYKAQCHGGMIVTKRNHWTYMSYCSGFPALIVPVVRDDYTAKLEAALNEFHELYQTLLARVQAGRDVEVIAATAGADPEIVDQLF